MNLVAVRVVLRWAFRYIVSLPSKPCKGSFGKIPNIKYKVGTSLIENDLVDNFLEYQDVLKCIFVNNFRRIEKGVEDFTLRGKVSYKFSNDLFLFFNEAAV